MFQALRLHHNGTTLSSSIDTLAESDLPNEGDVTLAVRYSSLNYKDGLAVTGRGKIVRGAYPFVPGIDLVGQVTASETDAYALGDWVIGTGWGLGENHWGGYSQVQRVQSDWLVPLPKGLSPVHAMAMGTAGLTAMLSVMALAEHGITPEKGKVVVTGASGGVGSMSVTLLAQRGYHVVASTGKAASHAYLSELGAAEIIHRDVLGKGPKRPLDRGLWAGAIDSVGSATLAAVLSQTARHGAVAACGLAAGHDLPTTVFPFILRGVNLLGIDSNTCPIPRRTAAWNRLAEELSAEALDAMMEVIPLSDVPRMADVITRGQVQGRVVVDVQAG